MSRRISNRRLPTKHKIAFGFADKAAYRISDKISNGIPTKSRTKRFGAPHGAPFLFDKLIKIRKKTCQSAKNMLQSFSLKKASDRGVVQLVESRSPKPLVLGSSPSAPAKESESNRFRIFYFGGARTRTLFPGGKRVLRRQKRSKSPRPWHKAADDAQSRFWARRPKHPTGVFEARLPSAPAKAYKCLLSRYSFPPPGVRAAEFTFWTGIFSLSMIQ